ncbi:MAG: HPP family protein [Zetaproteobacteria bacterium]|nr:MAG: HPP family protein [Zetaproteobacteria bacterium]
MTQTFPHRLAQATATARNALLGLGLVAAVHEWLYGSSDLPLIIAAFGATAVVLYGCPDAPIARPKNVFLGSLISALVGVLASQLLPMLPVWLVGMLAIGVALFAMTLSNTLHPPGGALAFIAVAGPPEIHALGLWFVLYPVLTGVSLMFVVAHLTRRWPTGR